MYAVPTTGWSRSLQIIVIVVAVGVLMRLAWAILRGDGGALGGEAFMVARAVAEGRGIADAYQPGQGPTAHLLPISPAIAGAIEYVLSSRIGTARLVQSFWSIGCALASYLLLFRAFGTLGVSRSARVVALALLCLVPVYITQEAVDFRAWEGGLAVLLAALFIDRAATAARSHLDIAGALLLAAIAALAFVVNPVVGVALFAAGLVISVRALSLRQMVLLVSAAAVMLAIPVGWWAARNARLLGHAVLLRSNGGLELALANRPDAVDGRDQAAGYYRQLNAIHPHSNFEAYRRLQAAGGEVEYSRRLGAEAAAWMRAHPLDTLRLMARHIRQLFAPPAWAFSQLDGGMAGKVKAALASLAGVLGLLGLSWRAGSRDSAWLAAACLIIVPALLISPFQPIARYCYLIFALSVFFGTDFVDRLIRLRRA